MDNFGQRVTDLRERYGWTRRELAKRTGLHEQHLLKIEQGLRKRIEGDTIIRLARALGCSADYLLGLKVEEDPEPRSTISLEVPMSELHREHDTVDAIQRLQDDYPFATGLLIYCLIERMLKYFIISEINNPQSILDIRFRHPLKGRTEEELRINLTDLTIGSIADKFNKSTALKEAKFFKNVANRHNNYMHSNNLIPPRANKDKEQRSKEHKMILYEAIKDLQLTFDYLKESHEIIIDKDGRICDFRPRQ